MTVDRREKHTEVVSYNASEVRPVNVRLRDPTSASAYQTGTANRGPHAAQRTQVLKFQPAIYLMFGILEGLLGIRFGLGLLGADPAAGFAQVIYGITASFIAPFVRLFGQPRFEGIVIEWNALVAILAYALLSWVFVKVMALIMSDARRGKHTTTSSHIDNA